MGINPEGEAPMGTFEYQNMRQAIRPTGNPVYRMETNDPVAAPRERRDENNRSICQKRDRTKEFPIKTRESANEKGHCEIVRNMVS